MSGGLAGPVLAIDPGRDKCGIAVVDATAALLHHRVVPTATLTDSLEPLMKQFRPARILLGDGTWSRKVRPSVEQAISIAHETPAEYEVVLEVVNERHTTERARQLYWKHNPPRGLRRLVPLGLQVPPEPWDDYAALCMAIDYLSQLT